METPAIHWPSVQNLSICTLSAQGQVIEMSAAPTFHIVYGNFTLLTYHKSANSNLKLYERFRSLSLKSQPSHISAKCDETMIDAQTSADTVAITSSVAPEEASKALSNSGEAFTATADPSTYITLTLDFKSTTTAKVTNIFLEVLGVQEVFYQFSSGSSSVSSPTEYIDPAVKTKVTSGELPNPVEADQLIVYLKPASADVPVVVSNFYVKACFGQGKQF